MEAWNRDVETDDPNKTVVAGNEVQRPCFRQMPWSEKHVRKAWRSCHLHFGGYHIGRLGVFPAMADRENDRAACRPPRGPHT